MNSQDTPFDWSKVNWSALTALRANFIGDSKVHSKYWSFDEQLASYHVTLGERIGWKWDAVLRELTRRGIEIDATHALDWGCGSGVAALRISQYLKHLKSISLWDHSPVAVNFAAEKVTSAYPEIDLIELKAPPSKAELLLLSHVLNEIEDKPLEALLQLIRNSKWILWVENGTRATSRRLSAIRDSLLGDFEVLAPCTHQNNCPVLEEGFENDWCHSFASVPSYVHHDAGWREFSKRLSIDLRRLPYSFLVLKKRDVLSRLADSDLSRLIGEARHYKGYSKLLSCDRLHGLSELILQKRDVPKLYKDLQKGRIESALFDFKVVDKKIVSGENL